MTSGAIPPHLRVWRVVSALDAPAFMVGAFAAVMGHRWGAYVLLANLVVQIGFHLMVGVRAYREVMSRPWPKVTPLDDDEWDE